MYYINVRKGEPKTTNKNNYASFRQGGANNTTTKKRRFSKMTLNNIYLIKEGEPVRLGSYYYEPMQKGKNELLDTNDNSKAVGSELNLGAFPLIKNNQFNKYLRENKSFLFKATVQAWDKEQKERIYSYDKLDLYLAASDIITQEEREEIREMRKGNKEHIKSIYFVLSRPLFLASAYDLLLFKTWEEIPQQWQHNAKPLKERLEENKSYWIEKGKLETIAQFEKKIKEGFFYSCFTVSSRFPSCDFLACCGVVREEKSNDYKHAEKIKEEMNKHIYKSNQLSIYEVLELLKCLNISIKRK